MIPGLKKKRFGGEDAEEQRGSGELQPACRTRTDNQQEVLLRLKPWKELAQAEELPITPSELARAVRLIDPETTPDGAPSAITTGARPRFWNKIGSAEMKTALIAAMLAHEGLNRMSKLKEPNSFNLPSNELLIKVLEGSMFDGDTKGLAVLLMLKQPIGTRAVEALKTISASAEKSDFLATTLGAAARKLNNALKSANA